MAHLVQNKYLDKENRAHNNGEVWVAEQWKSIVLNEGSVQHLEWMDEWDKEIFKTACELDQRWVIDHAAGR